jgi:predicted secreted protein
MDKMSAYIRGQMAQAKGDHSSDTKNARRSFMNKFHLSCAFLLFSAFASVAFPTPDAGKAVIRFSGDDDEESTRRITLTTGQELEVRLPVRISTGYSWWRVGKPSKELEKMGDVEGKPDDEGEGGMGCQIFRFRAKQPGTVKLRFVYRRPSKDDKPPEKERFVHAEILLSNLPGHEE